MVDPTILLIAVIVLGFDVYVYYEYRHSKEELEKLAGTKRENRTSSTSPRAASIYSQLSPTTALSNDYDGDSGAMLSKPVNPDVQSALQDLSVELGTLRTQVQVLGTPSEYIEVKALQHSLEDLKSHKERSSEDIELLKQALEDLRDDLENVKAKPRRQLTAREIEQRERELQKLYMQRKVDEQTFRELHSELTRAKLDF